jgi:CRISPR-associated endonuclease/helicase Cas3
MKPISLADKLVNEFHMDSYHKTSHRKHDLQKELIEHIGDIKSISRKLARKYELAGFLDILDILAENHDIGKLNPQWSVDRDRRPPHSALSAYLFLRCQYVEDPRLFYLLLKHHSNLTKPSLTMPSVRKNIVGRIKYSINRKEASTLVLQEIRKLKKRVRENRKRNVIMADLFGIFKSGDIVSAMFEEENEIFNQNLDFEIDLVEQRMRSYVKSRNLAFDEEKWKISVEMGRTDRNILFLAPTGWGKTFAALTIALSKKPSSIMIVLPTITSIRRMKKTINKIIENVSVKENYYFADTEALRRANETEEADIELDLFVSKSFLSPITITTLDQLLLSFLHVGKYFLKRFNFRNAVLIFDEFHLYPINGLYILLYFLGKFNKDFGYNMKTVFMSATVHPFFRDLIAQFTVPKQFEFLQEYKKKRRYLYSLEQNDITEKEMIKKILRESDHKNVLVVCNTVQKAIRVYLLLKKNHKKMDSEFLLLHSRYTYDDRREKEEKLEKLADSPGSFVFISTQVAEVSLDITFDYLFTELAPIPSLIQRCGRVNRYSNLTNQVNVAITLPKEIGSSKFYPYEKNELDFSFTVLSELEGKVESEYELIKLLRNAPISINYLGLEEIRKYLKKWEDDTEYFYAIDLGNEELNRILKFRETNTALIIPDCFREEVLEILFGDKKYKTQLVKRYFVPVPIWWLFENSQHINKEKNILFLSNPRFIYSDDVGYFDRDKLNNFMRNLGYEFDDVSNII